MITPKLRTPNEYITHGKLEKKGTPFKTSNNETWKLLYNNLSWEKEKKKKITSYLVKIEKKKVKKMWCRENPPQTKNPEEVA